ncbi:flagellar basal body P-ring formation chaperone FlgA [Celerinatantimonas diazotrophica]|uniref:Flagella basal body P-ring formation protein FlgA n=1 Tax=Celerinatantimonas diazotrophica TaxID=412034 RepID=A0A4R1JMC2_9GAMM|nr:flagellar basal body P-ring formation chaperone FlgA [Celerinatantimonas diazotrophica]TCK52177.1 flagella basal body P-ring formation protein FlgA [Celerinatantimonas diazotrophica]CAG9296118.1 hypothetical protein CEDIAZO_01261 [Celerinatantimonas diazotrophica]
MIKQILCSIALLFISYNTSATPDIASKLQAQAVAYVKNKVVIKADQRVKVEAANIDPRTNFKSCKNFHYFLTDPQISKHNTVRVTCDEDHNFRLYIPVKVTTLIPIVTMKTTADAGDTIEQSDLKISYLSQNRIFGTHYSHINELLGAKLKRRVNRNQPLTRYDICIVCRGDSVKIVAQGRGLYISTSGTALADGLVGDTIRVRNNQSQRTINAIINSVGKVTVRM